jgi:hypothetical protein
MGRCYLFAEPPVNDRYLRSPDGRTRRQAIIADREDGSCRCLGARQCVSRRPEKKPAGIPLPQLTIDQFMELEDEPERFERV